MFKIDDRTYDIICRQGDTGEYPIEGLPTEGINNALVYLSFYNNKRVILSEISVEPDIEGNAKFYIPSEMTDKLTVPSGASSATYYYGLKLCYKDNEEKDWEDTLVINGKKAEDVNKIIVYPKIVEGGVTNE